MKVALLAGGTGLTGSIVLQLLLEDPEYHEVKVITRRPLEAVHPKLTAITADYGNINSVAPRLTCDVVYCCLGTTMKKARTREAFREVDYEYPVALARIARQHGARQFLLMSALGADRNSSIFYNRVKGETEAAVADVGFPSCHLFRPSLLLGSRREERSGEDAAKVFYRLFGFLVPKKYQAIEASKVARAMLHYARQEEEGLFIHESRELQQFPA